MNLPAPVRTSRAPRILVVDDAGITRGAMCQLLERRGFMVVGEADCVASAIEAVERLSPDALLLDVHLPDGSGFDLCARLTTTRPRVAVLLTSTGLEDQFYARAQKSGARGFVPKRELGRVDFSAFW